jgi:hypothetical protein
MFFWHGPVVLLIDFLEERKWSSCRFYENNLIKMKSVCRVKSSDKKWKSHQNLFLDDVLKHVLIYYWEQKKSYFVQKMYRYLKKFKVQNSLFLSEIMSWFRLWYTNEQQQNKRYLALFDDFKESNHHKRN